LAVIIDPECPSPSDDEFICIILRFLLISTEQLRHTRVCGWSIQESMVNQSAGAFDQFVEVAIEQTTAEIGATFCRERWH
jgi:hypothetical protein